jgi:hypothetical protein
LEPFFLSVVATTEYTGYIGVVRGSPRGEPVDDASSPDRHPFPLNLWLLMVKKSSIQPTR